MLLFPRLCRPARPSPPSPLSRSAGEGEPEEGSGSPLSRGAGEGVGGEGRAGPVYAISRTRPNGGAFAALPATTHTTSSGRTSAAVGNRPSRSVR
jgi:hypothetical protein